MNRCAYLSDALTDGGDSGGPVFFNLGSGAIVAAGIINAKSVREWGPTTIFSGWSSLYPEVTGSSPAPFSLNVLAPITPTYSASINGPWEMKPGTCYWNVSASFPYTDVEWKVNGNTVGTGPELYYAASSNFNLQVQVINSGTGAGAADSRSITVTSNSSQCFVE